MTALPAASEPGALRLAVTDSDLSTAFIEVISFFSRNSRIKFRDDDAIYSVPALPDSTLETVTHMIHDGVSLSGCCAFLSPVLSFDPAIVNAVHSQQFSETAAQLCLIANTIGWVGSDDFCNADYLELMIDCLLPSGYFDTIRQFCLKLVISHCSQVWMTDIPIGLVTKLTHYCVPRDVDSEFVLSGLYSPFHGLHGCPRVSAMQATLHTSQIQSIIPFSIRQTDNPWTFCFRSPFFIFGDYILNHAPVASLECSVPRRPTDFSALPVSDLVFPAFVVAALTDR